MPELKVASPPKTLNVKVSFSPLSDAVPSELFTPSDGIILTDITLNEASPLFTVILSYIVSSAGFLNPKSKERFVFKASKLLNV